MPDIFGGTNGNWMDEFLQGEEMEKIANDAHSGWEDDVIHAVKARTYASLDEALTSLKERTGLTENLVHEIKASIVKKTAMDTEWHKLLGTNSPQMSSLRQAKNELVSIANELDRLGLKAEASEIDDVLRDLP